MCSYLTWAQISVSINYHRWRLKMKAIQVKTNKRGIQYALVQSGETFCVLKLCENYCRHVKGGIAKTWRYVETGMTIEQATALFNRRGA
jgi:hypothetical protein